METSQHLTFSGRVGRFVSRRHAGAGDGGRVEAARHQDHLLARGRAPRYRRTPGTGQADPGDCNLYTFEVTTRKVLTRKVLMRKDLQRKGLLLEIPDYIGPNLTILYQEQSSLCSTPVTDCQDHSKAHFFSLGLFGFSHYDFPC